MGQIPERGKKPLPQVWGNHKGGLKEKIGWGRNKASTWESGLMEKK